MENVEYQIIEPDDNENIMVIANWYLSEWNIPTEITIQKIKNLSEEGNEFQVLMKVNDKAIATGGIYNHVGIIDKEPRLKIHKNWLALVYTTPQNRDKGYGFLICTYIQTHSKKLGLKEINLFTHTAESLYNRLGWEKTERIVLGEKEIVIMKIGLQ